MKYDTLIPIAIVVTVLFGIINLFAHFMPYSAPTVLLMLFIACCEVFEVLKDKLSKRGKDA